MTAAAGGTRAGMTAASGGVKPGGGLLVAVGSLDPAHLEYLRLVLGEVFGFPFRIHDRPMPADVAYDPVRHQWNAAKLLPLLEEMPEARGAQRVLGVTEADLFIPILTFVFGLAYLEARAAVISVHRLHPEFYGLPADPDLVLRRLEKEALHEVGHTYGLKHCDDRACVMHYSNTAEEVDLKEARYCPVCEARVQHG
jgi:archaemetzincin